MDPKCRGGRKTETQNHRSNGAPRGEGHSDFRRSLVVGAGSRVGGGASHPLLRGDRNRTRILLSPLRAEAR